MRQVEVHAAVLILSPVLRPGKAVKVAAGDRR